MDVSFLPARMRLLFVKLKHIGDSLLLTPTLAAVRAMYPQAEIWVVVREGSQGILSGCPAIDRLLTVAAPESACVSPSRPSLTSLAAASPSHRTRSTSPRPR